MKRMVRVRFAPSPTGALHIGGLRTALFNYLFAKSQGGVFILRIEDTDQKRYVEGAEKYILDSLHWLGMVPEEGPNVGGDYGPYRQSERQKIYHEYIQILLKNGSAYYAFDSSEELEEMRRKETERGIHSPKYDHTTRGIMRNSLTLSQDEVQALLDKGENVTVRLKVDPGTNIRFEDVVRDQVTIASDELDDKVLIKADGLPTYHFANVVDDYLMQITHVIRGEEWISSTAHHVLLYQSFGWESTMPVFAHLPLILKPTGKGKLSKRDGAKFGFPVFPLSWDREGEDPILGFDAFGFLPEAVANFLALLGWSPGDDQEIFSMEELISKFSLEHIHKAGARFDYEKAKWFNQQYILQMSVEQLVPIVKEQLEEKNLSATPDFLNEFVRLMQPRVTLLTDFLSEGSFFFGIDQYDEKTLKKKYKSQFADHYVKIGQLIGGLEKFDNATIEQAVKEYMAANELGFGAIFPILRIFITGKVSGPDIFETMALLGQKECEVRYAKGLEKVSLMGLE